MKDKTGKIDMTEEYSPREIEPKWQKKWEEAGIYRAKDPPAGGAKKYILFEFPYPSGDRLHVGHGRSYTALDAMARKARMQGFNVLLPMGWDAFGLPAENYAIRTGINPNITTKENIAHSRQQAKRWGLSIDWEREINTTDPKYYRWTQWIFLQLYKHNLAYWAEAPVNWCPACKSILANEEVLSDGTHERCGKPTEKRMQKQWVLKITAYADRLLEDLKEVDYLPKIALQQINWIGKSEGAEIEFRIKNYELGIKVFTTRPDTLYGATFMVVAPEHELVKTLANKEVEEYVEKAKKKTELERTELIKDKTGVFSGLQAINPATGKEIPIWISDFVLSSYGTGAIMAVPAHDERDHTFAQKFGLPITPVITPSSKWDFNKSAYTEVEKGKTINSPEWNDLVPAEAIKKASLWIEEKGIGKKAVSYHLRDWIFSRQHYWGEPIPMIHCEKCGVVPVPEKDLPVELPYVEKYQPTETGESPLAKIKEWVNVACPKCGGPARRETDTMPNWAGSNWYFVRYLDPQNEQKLVDLDKAKYWLPVDLYNGGMEHTTLHLLYSRFIYKFLFDIGAVPTKEPYARRRSHGMVLGPDGQKMSKSLGNVINPDEVIEAFGADTFRLYESFIGPFDQMVAWSEESVEGCHRFLKRIWNLVISNKPLQGKQLAISDSEKNLERKLNRTIKKVGEDIEAMKFNTAVAAMMELLNEAISNKPLQGKQLAISREFLQKFLLILAPFAPFMTEELWERLGNKFSIHQQPWPEYDPQLLSEEMITIVVQINGKVRENFSVPPPTANSQQEIERLATKNEKIQKYLTKSQVKKVIFVPGKLINFVI